MVAPAGVHVRTWSGSGSATITDMTNAGRRGKKCRQLRFTGWVNTGGRDTDAGKVSEATLCIVHEITLLDSGLGFDEFAAAVRGLYAKYTDGLASRNLIGLNEDEIRGVDAPRPMLTAGVRGSWSASADEGGVSVHDIADVNQWTEASRGSAAKAYEAAAKVWPNVQNARTRREAVLVLEAAGLSLHGWCAMD